MPLAVRLQRAAARHKPLTLSASDVVAALPLLAGASRTRAVIDALRAAIDRAGSGAGRKVSGADLDALEFVLSELGKS